MRKKIQSVKGRLVRILLSAVVGESLLRAQENAANSKAPKAVSVWERPLVDSKGFGGSLQSHELIPSQSLGLNPWREH